MNTQATTTNTYTKQKTIAFSPINWINQFIEKEKTNALAITLTYIMLGTGIGSITAALSIHNTVNLFILMTSTSLAMATLASVLSLQPFKTSTWIFITNVLINTGLLVYQLINLSF